jgi:hypothetical protein
VLSEVRLGPPLSDAGGGIEIYRSKLVINQVMLEALSMGPGFSWDGQRGGSG